MVFLMVARKTIKVYGGALKAVPQTGWLCFTHPVVPCRARTVGISLREIQQTRMDKWNSHRDVHSQRPLPCLSSPPCLSTQVRTQVRPHCSQVRQCVLANCLCLPKQGFLKRYCFLKALKKVHLITTITNKQILLARRHRCQSNSLGENIIS